MKGKRILVSAAHPDDADYYCGGAVARWAAEGAEITYLICTDGALGADEGGITMEELAALRKKEQNAANKALGVKETIYLDYPDYGLTATPELRMRIAAEIRRFKPHILATFDPWLRYELHPDHTVAGRESMYARIGSKIVLAYPELLEQGLEPWAVDELYFFKTDQPDTWVETEDYLPAKLKALACHQSQFAALVPDEEQGLPLLRQLSKKHPKTGRIAEGFKRMPLEGIEGLMAYIAL